MGLGRFFYGAGASTPGGGGETASEGTYAPTVTPIEPGTLGASAPEAFTWIRIGDTVHVSGILDVVPATLNGNNQIDVTLPVASSDVSDLAGVCSGNRLTVPSFDILNTPGMVLGVSGKARLYFALNINNAPSAFTMGVQFQYRVVP